MLTPTQQRLPKPTDLLACLLTRQPRLNTATQTNNWLKQQFQSSITTQLQRHHDQTNIHVKTKNSQQQSE
ncbi:hypothetical protein LDENG_00001440, partial [Lucifuga dentata]